MTLTDTRREAPPRTLRPLAAVLSSLAVALTATRVSAIALPWFVLVTTGSATLTGLVAFCEMAPYVLVKALTGPLVDRVGPRAVCWTADVLSAAAAGLIPLFHTLGLLHFWLLPPLVAVIGAVRGPGDLARDVMVPEAAERGRVPLERATGLAGVIEQLAATVGPAAGGALVAAVGPLTALVANAACFALGSLLIVLLPPRGTGRPAAAAPPEPGYWRRLGEGFAFLRGDPLLLTITVVVGAGNFLQAGFSQVLVPVWARESGAGPAAIGLVNAVFGGMAVCSGILAAAIAHRLRRRPVFFAGYLLAEMPRFLILAVDAPLWLVAVVFAVGGCGSGFLNPILGAISFERVPREMLGRVRALSGALAWAGIPFGGLVAGSVVGVAGLGATLAGAGAAHGTLVGVGGMRKEWAEMERGRRPVR
ncbi:MFS transporter [Streptomyces sp. AV19]|uniref:MFS transporter n=1 Tax=Streptomyces sp. AV19 TaxID=2793068 RepID=UPI0018FE9F67|nr:MFS transporter [Streptomyces sp. AV19]MBH1937915.1 MFS transporter [Streptomyces sp. AV19]MDG4536552.1 MFS transporter [Streptomyces sp. AV19]